MFRSRIIPCLLLKQRGFYKTTNFKNPRYLGDPINTIMLFNNKEVDEIIVLDIEASMENKAPDIEFIKKFTSECFIPLCYGGGVSTLQQVEQLFKAGIEKVSFNTTLYTNKQLIKDAVRNFGSQSIIGSVDVKKSFLNKYHTYIKSGKIKIKDDFLEYIKEVTDLDIGELVVTSIDNEGSMKGYDYNLIEKISEVTDIPFIINGGAGSLFDCVKAVDSGASAAAASSIFVYYGPLKAVLINYPTQDELNSLFRKVKE